MFRRTMIIIYLIFFTKTSIGQSKPRLDIRGILLPPCKENEENPFQFNGNLAKLDDHMFTFNGTFIGDRKLKTPAEVNSEHLFSLLILYQNDQKKK